MTRNIYLGSGSDKLYAVIHDILSMKRAHERSGTQDEEESITFLRSQLRDEGWTGLPNRDAFEALCEQLGFSVRTDDRGRTYIGLAYDNCGWPVTSPWGELPGGSTR
jgi:hypothetical protein